MDHPTPEQNAAVAKSIDDGLAEIGDGIRALKADNERLRSALRAARVVVEAVGARATLQIIDAALALSDT